MTVVLKTNGASGYKLDEGKFELDGKHRLPVREIERKFNVAQLHWIDGNEPLPEASDGYSSIAFELYRGKVLELACNPLGPGFEVSRPTNVKHHTTVDSPVSRPLQQPQQKGAVDSPNAAIGAADDEPKSLTAKNEEDRLLKSLNKKRATAASNTIFSQPRAEKAAVPPAESVGKATASAAAPAAAAAATATVPAWKKKRDEEEAALKAQMAAPKVNVAANSRPVAAQRSAPVATKTAAGASPAAPAAAAAAAPSQSLEDQARQRQAQLDLEAAEEARLEKSLFGKGAENRRSATLKAKRSTGPTTGDAAKVEAVAAKVKAEVAVSAPAPAAPAKPTQPANAHAESASATAIHKAAAVLFTGPHGSGDVKALVGAVKDAAESLEIDAFVAALGKLFAAGGGEAQLGKLREAVAQAQAVAVNGQRFADDPDNESAMEQYTAANGALVATLDQL